MNITLDCKGQEMEMLNCSILYPFFGQEVRYLCFLASVELEPTYTWFQWYTVTFELIAEKYSDVIMYICSMKG